MQQFVKFRNLIEDRCGLHFDDSQRSSLSSSISARMQRLGIDEVQDYYEYLVKSNGAASIEAEFRHLINLVTITETCFFRDAAQFRMLRELILPSIIADRVGRDGANARQTIRIWSAGCSSGEEAYSIAIMLSDMGAYLAYPNWTFEIIGTDINTKVLEAARRGVYNTRAVRNLEANLLQQYFRQECKDYVLDDEIKKRVRFEQGNLAQLPMPSTGLQDIVLCKNVTIYFKADVSRRLVDGLRDSLTGGGYLLLGHAESLWQMDEGFELVEHAGAFGYRKRGRVPFSTAVLEKGTRPLFRSEQYADCLAAFRASDWEKAESGLRNLLRAAPTFAPARVLLGGVYAHTGRYDEAASEAEALLKLSEFDARGHLLLGMIAARQQRIDQAMQSLRRALYLDDSLALAHFWLGNLYRDRGDLVRARNEYEHVVRDSERHTLDLTEEFASDLTAEQLVGFCSDSLRRLHNEGEPAPTWQ